MIVSLLVAGGIVALLAAAMHATLQRRQLSSDVRALRAEVLRLTAALNQQRRAASAPAGVGPVPDDAESSAAARDDRSPHPGSRTVH